MVFYDLTTFGIHGEGAVDVEVFADNTTEVDTFLPILDRIRQR